MTSASCLCGKVRLQYQGEPKSRNLCHCTDCRKVSGSTATINISVPDDRFELTEGTPKTYTKKADSGEDITSFFCGDCGCTLWRETGTFPGMKIIQGGALDDANALNTSKPKLELYAARRVDWVAEVPGIQQVEAMPPKQ